MKLNKKITLAVLLLIRSLIIFSEDSKNILFLSSYNPSFPTFVEQENGIRDQLIGQNYLLDIEFMDSKRFTSKELDTLFFKTLKIKLDNLPKYDGILTSDDNALKFAVKNKDVLFKDTPIIFFGVNDLDYANEMNYISNITGYIEDTSVEETLELILKIHSNNEDLIIISDSTVSGQSDLKKVKDTIYKYYNMGYKVLDLSGLTFNQFGKRLEQISLTQPVLLLSAYKDVNNEHKTFNESLNFILLHLKSPLYHLWYHGLGQGIIGGKLISHYEQGKAATILLKDVIDNKRKVENIKVSTKSPNKYLFDYNVLKNFNIKRSKLPKDSGYINLTNLSFENSRDLFWLILLLSVLVILIILIILISIKYRLTKKRLLIDNATTKSYVDSIINSINIGIISLDRDYNIISQNRYIKNLFKGYASEYGGNNIFQVYPFIKHISKCKDGRRIIDYIGSMNKYLEFSSQPLENNTGYIIQVEDVSSRIEFEKKLLKQRRVRL
ncbi:hypothetical protein EW093_12455 [Thiospirochaeta perfilievii]|uniref:PAS domain-containing protein n=1 Tax=Thiospirochaeta perfilievii TaxID=252967 RepID=A0A5C1QD53_9SPIO|nr:hypothetical protein [Thiospirochaeta perfilievii]QEN05491.1 hypothetical protein EW093_12455 [Thiospirochaeta perfilievii]